MADNGTLGIDANGGQTTRCSASTRGPDSSMASIIRLNLSGDTVLIPSEHDMIDMSDTS